MNLMVNTGRQVKECVLYASLSAFLLSFQFSPKFALCQTAPYPPSSVIESIGFDFGTQEQHGQGSDQWPMTWGSDGNIYAVWGDGNGWDGGGPYLYMGIDQIAGSPPGLTGTELWQSSDKNRKPLGVVAAANQTLYLFYDIDRDNWDGSYGMYSSDNGRTWTDTSTRVFGLASDGVKVVGIAQFGPGYTNVPAEIDNNYFYVYLAGRRDGKDGQGKEVYLGKVAKTQIFSRSAYTYFNGVDGSGKAIWSSSWSDKQVVFYDPAGMEYHVNVSYNPAIGRFIYAKGQNTNQLGIFEGTTLWGPWGTIYYGQFKDGYWKFTYQFPQKWMSANGLTMWMAWSGWPEYDNVNFIKTTLTLRTLTDITPPASPTALKVQNQ